MDVSVIYAVIDHKVRDKESAGVCYIVAYKNNEKRIITDEKKIAEVFSNNLVFIAKGLDSFNPNDVIEILFTGLDPGSKELKKLPRVIFSTIKNSSATLLVEIHEPMIRDGFLDLTLIKDGISDSNKLMIKHKKFYLSFGDTFIGPFKFVNESIIPFNSTTAGFYSMKEVDVLEYPNLNNQKFYDILLLLDLPKPLYFIDCCTENQLIEWLKSKIRTEKDDKKIAEILNQFKSTFKYSSLNDSIEKSRFLRAEKILSSLKLNSTELAKIKDHPDFKDVLKAAVKENSGLFAQEIYEEQARIKEELEQQNVALITQYKDEVTQQKKLSENLESEISTLGNMLLEKQVEIDKLGTKIAGLQKEETYIQNNIEAITTQLKLTVSTISIPQQSPLANEHVQFFERLEFIDSSAEYYEDFYEFDEEVQGSFLKRNIENLSKNRFFIAYDCSCVSVLRLLKSTGDIIVYLQQAEGDWLKFNKWYKNGFSQFLTEALDKPHLNYCFVLQDCNIASPECYAKPILDVSNGIRKKVPNTQVPWPDNVWIIFVPLEVDMEDFGFSVNEDTFKSWMKFEGKDSATNLDFRLSKKWDLRKKSNKS